MAKWERHTALAERIKLACEGSLSDDEDARLLAAFYAICPAVGHFESVDCLIGVLRRGELVPRLQKVLAEALDPNGKSHMYFKRQYRQRGGAKKIASLCPDTSIDQFVENELAEHPESVEAAVMAAMQEFGVSRSTVMAARKHSPSIQKIVRNLAISIAARAPILQDELAQPEWASETLKKLTLGDLARVEAGEISRDELIKELKRRG